MDTMAASQAFASQPFVPQGPATDNTPPVAATPEQIMQRYVSTRPNMNQVETVATTQSSIKQRYLGINAAPAQRSEPHLWSLINNYFPTEGADFQFWWRTTGIPFAVLLQKSGYSMDLQCQHLLFFYSCVVPQLGSGPNSRGLPKQWKSFMTDNFSPIELSWEWGTGGSPTIRFSFEPIGQQAGTPADPLNQYATNRLVRQYEPMMTDCDLSLYEHFSRELLSYNYTAKDLESEGHKSRTFVAFDLGKDGIMLKAYFMPNFKAAELKQSSWKTIVQSIQSVPAYTPEEFPGLAVVQKFMETSPQGPGMTAEIFAMDCVEPSQSRYKIYVRSRQTNFEAVKDVMTLGGAVSDSKTEKGLKELEKLWRLALALPEDYSTADELPQRDHRTAGILYYFDIKQGSAKPGVKLYIPARHYSKNDMAAAENVTSYVEGRGQGYYARKYMEALKTVSTESALRNKLGTQSYVGCSIAKGELKLISYVSPTVYSKPQ